jgi:hypothetical protein
VAGRTCIVGANFRTADESVAGGGIEFTSALGRTRTAFLYIPVCFQGEMGGGGLLCPAGPAQM